MDKAVLDKILDNHKEWLQTNGKKGEQANLREADLRGADLCGAVLRGADLRDADLRRADLCGADLYRADLRRADLRGADLWGADLRGANLHRAVLRGADLRGADLDFSAFPLWCGGLDVHIDDRQAVQLLYHLVRNVQYSKNTSDEMKKLFSRAEIVRKANEFHRVDGCGRIEGQDDG